MLLPTTLVGSYAQPEWLIDRAKLAGRFPPRVRAKELWRIPEPYLAEAQDDATIARHQGCRRRPGSTSSPTARSAARAIRTASPRRSRASTSTIPASRWTAPAIPIPCRASSGKIRRKHPVEVEDLKFLRRHTDRRSR